MIDIKVNLINMMPEDADGVMGISKGHLRVEGSRKVIVAEMVSLLHALQDHYPEELAEATELIIKLNESR